MATKNGDRVLLGAGSVTLGGWATAGGTPSPVAYDLGYIDGPIVLTDAEEDVSIEVENAAGVLRSVPTKKAATLQVIMSQAELLTFFDLARLATGNKTGTGDNLTLGVDAPTEKYFQLGVTCKGHGTNKQRVITLWKCSSSQRGPINIGKNEKALFDVTFTVHEDDSITAGGTTGRFFKIQDS